MDRPTVCLSVCLPRSLHTAARWWVTDVPRRRSTRTLSGRRLLTLDGTREHRVRQRYAPRRIVQRQFVIIQHEISLKCFLLSSFYAIRVRIKPWTPPSTKFWTRAHTLCWVSLSSHFNVIIKLMFGLLTSLNVLRLWEANQAIICIDLTCLKVVSHDITSYYALFSIIIIIILCPFSKICLSTVSWHCNTTEVSGIWIVFS